MLTRPRRISLWSCPAPVERRDVVMGEMQSFVSGWRRVVSVDSAEMCQYCQGSNQRPKITSSLGR